VVPDGAALTPEPAGHFAAERIFPMQKATSFYESIFFCSNHGWIIGPWSRNGLKRAPRNPQYSGTWNMVRRCLCWKGGTRADITPHFCITLEGAETADSADFDKCVRERREGNSRKKKKKTRKRFYGGEMFFQISEERRPKGKSEASGSCPKNSSRPRKQRFLEAARFFFVRV